MRFGSILLLAIGLAMDAMAVSAARGIAVSKLRLRHAGIVAAFFGLFQAGMPVLGWFLGQTIGSVVAAFSHWIAFVLLVGIGLKMLHEARSTDEAAAAADAASTDRQLFGFKVMTALAIATSIDAFAVGVTLPMVGAPLLLSVVTIGVTTAVLSALGLVAGRKFGAVLGRGMDALGGVVLIALGAKILIDHFIA